MKQGGKFMKQNQEKISVAKGGIEYILTENEKEGISVYGIKIVCTLFGEEEVFCHEDVTDDYDTAKELLNLLADYVVLPCTALEIIDEYIDAKSRINM